MFLGHYGVGFAAKRFAPSASLGTLLFAAQFVDLVWPILVLAGVEVVRIDPGNTVVTPLDFVSYPFTHSLAAGLGWGLLLGLVYLVIRRSARGALVVGLAVVSHWVLDWISHRPDLALYPGGPKVGLGLWQSLTGTLVVELTLFAIGLGLYLATTRPLDRTGRWGLAALVALLLASYGGALFGPPPPSDRAIAWVGLGGWLLPLAGVWVDRHRALRRPATVRR
jgi:membrane-bound metal-dependent hydrolase YbcI (DUF457 family)